MSPDEAKALVRAQADAADARRQEAWNRDNAEACSEGDAQSGPPPLPPEEQITATRQTVGEWIENAYREGWFNCRDTMGHSIEADWLASTAKVMAESRLPYLARPAASVEAGPSRGAVAPLAPEGFGVWIACADRMPPICPCVLVWVADLGDPTDGWFEIAYWPGPEYGWYTDHGVKRTEPDPITHWMPLPKSHPSTTAQAGKGIPPSPASPAPSPEGNESVARRLMQAAIRYGQLVAIGRVLRDMDRDAASQGSFHERDEINLTARASAEAMSHCMTLMAKIQSAAAAPLAPEVSG